MAEVVPPSESIPIAAPPAPMIGGAEAAAYASAAQPAAGRPWLRALRHRNYRLFFGGQSVSLIGTWMQSVAVSWLVLRLTDSPLVLGQVGFAAQIPVLLLGPLAGIVADHWPLRAVLIGMQSAALVQASVLAALTLSHTITVWHVIGLSLLLGTINAFDMTARQAFVVQMVDRPEDLSNAIALNSTLMNGTRLIGPSIAGVVISAIGEGLCFLLNAISYIGVIAALLAMRTPPRPRSHVRPPVWRSLVEGFAYGFGFPPIRYTLALLAVTSLLGMSYATVLPVFVREVLGGDSRVYGLLLGAAGLGALCGAVFIARRRSVLGLGRVLASGGALFGCALVALSFMRSVPPAAALLALAGLGMILQITSTNTVLQTIVDDDKRGRVMSLYTMAFIGMTPFGSLLAGWLTEHLGAPAALRIGGGGCILAATAYASVLPALRRLVRPIYVRKGIYPAAATAPRSHAKRK